MDTGLYRCKVMHNRLSPVRNSFSYNVFMFWLNLDEIDSLSKRFFLISRNRFNIFCFREKDHLVYKNNKGTVKEQLFSFLTDSKIKTPAKVMLLTNLCTFGYQFNPVSFYFCFDEKDKPYACIPEVSNTFREMKVYFLGEESFKNGMFEKRIKKHFYVSPFIENDADFHFRIKVPDEKLNIRIDDINANGRFFISTLTGHHRELTNMRIAWYSVRFPFITIKVISLIHWQALKLWLKKIPYYKKADKQEHQKDYFKKITGWNRSYQHRNRFVLLRNYSLNA